MESLIGKHCISTVEEQDNGGFEDDCPRNRRDPKRRLRFGLHGLKSNLVGSHPLEAAYHATRRTHEEMNRKVLTYTYGSAFPLTMDLDRQILSRFQRPPGAISSSMLGLEAMTGSLDKIYFEDYSNDLTIPNLFVHTTCITGWKFVMVFPRDQSVQVSRNV